MVNFVVEHFSIRRFLLFTNYVSHLVVHLLLIVLFVRWIFRLNNYISRCFVHFVQFAVELFFISSIFAVYKLCFPVSRSCIVHSVVACVFVVDFLCNNYASRVFRLFIVHFVVDCFRWFSLFWFLILEVSRS